jgi:hypothetical protein
MRVIVLGLVALLAGCGEKVPEKPKEAAAPALPKITHFYGNQMVVPRGGNLTLCYGTENVEKLTLRPHEDGELRPSLNRCVGDTPLKDTTYTLTATGPGGVTTATYSVRVGPPVPPASAKERVLIQNFVVMGNTPTAPGVPRQLCYTAEGVSSISVQPAVTGGLTAGRNQCFVVKPQKTTTYILTATAADGSVDRIQVSVPVQGGSN